LSDIIPIVSGNETKKTTYGSLYYAVREGLVSGSSQLTASYDERYALSGSGGGTLPAGTVSGSAQITSFGFVSGSFETTGRGILSGSISYTNLTNIPSSLVSGSSQLTSSFDGRYESQGRGIISSSQQLPAGLVSGSSQIVLGDVTNFTSYSSSVESKIQNFNSFTQSYYIDSASFATTGSNTFKGNQTISGSVNISGSLYTDYIIFDSQSATPLVGYMLQANPVDKTLDLRMGDNNATLQLGQELYYPPIVNKSGGNLLNGCLVMFNPADPTQGNRIAVVKCISDGTYPADFIVGILTEDIAVNEEGFATWFGYVRDINRTELENAGLKDPAEIWTEGQILYPHPTRAGGLTNVQPTAPNLKSSICAITSINGVNITFLVRPHLRGTIKGLHDVIDNSTTSSYGDLLIKSGSVWTNSKTLNGDYTITGSLFVSGTTEFGGDLVPKFPSGSTLGTLERPFREIFVSSGSINIASDIPGDPNTSISNTGGNLLISAGGMRLIGDASFIAATGSFGYISGSMTQVGDYTQLGNYTLTGDKTISGSLTISGSGFINTHRILTDLDSGSYAVTGSNVFSGSQGISGSLYVSESLNITNGFYVDGNKQFNYGQFSDSTTQSGSVNTAYSMKFNTTDIATGFSIVSGSRITAQHTGIYNLQFSTQLDNPSNTNEVVDIWIAVTGSNIPNSTTTVAINKAQAGNIGKTVAAWNYMIPLSASQYVELKWNTHGGNIILLATGSASNPDRPATPSIIATITQIA
jgi:hypothetical protein